MLKALQTIQNINLTENIPKNLNTTEKIIMSRAKCCEQCDPACTIRNDVEPHDNKTHLTQMCELCRKEYSTAIQIKRHMWRNHEPVDCNDCGKDFLNRHDLKRLKLNKTT